MGCKNRVLSIRALWDPFTLTPCQSAMPADSIRLQVPGQAAGTPPGTVLWSTQLPVALPNVPPTGSALPRPVSFRFFSVNRSETSSKRSRAFDDRKTRQSKAQEEEPQGTEAGRCCAAAISCLAVGCRASGNACQPEPNRNTWTQGFKGHSI